MVCAPSPRSRRQADCCEGVAVQPIIFGVTPRQRARVLAETAGSGASPLDWFSSLSWSQAFIGSSAMSGFPESGPGVAIYEHRRPNETSLQYQNQSHEIEAIRARK